MAEETTKERDHRRESDPTYLTTAALLREISTLKEQLQSQLTGEVKVIEARFAAIDHATVVFQENLTRVPTDVQKAVANLQELQDARFHGLEKELQSARDVVQTRFDGMDRALKLLQDIADRFPDRIDEKITALKEIHEGQFQGIQVQFNERDIKVSETALATKTAVDAALAAAEKARSSQAESFALAAAKSEAAFAKQADQQGALVQTTTQALRDRLDELTERFARIEGQALGQTGQKTDQHQSSAFIIMLVSIGITIAMSLLAASAYIRPGR